MEFFFDKHALEEKLKIKFHNDNILKMAFTHRSFWNENREMFADHNERLEFLGDSILGLLVAEYLFRRHPELDEGSLSSLRSQLVDAPACAQYAHSLGIDVFLLLGKGERMNQGKGRESIIADLFEALIGALYLDQGIEGARDFFLTHFQQTIDKMIAQPQRNWKAELQDYAQKNFQNTPEYRIVDETGPAHKKIFYVSVWINGEKKGEGKGSSKKEAQVSAAENALKKIEIRN